MTEDKYFKRRAARIAAVHDALEETQDVGALPGVYRKLGAFWIRAPELSVRFVPPHIDLTKRQAE